MFFKRNIKILLRALMIILVPLQMVTSDSTDDDDYRQLQSSIDQEIQTTFIAHLAKTIQPNQQYVSLTQEEYLRSLEEDSDYSDDEYDHSVPLQPIMPPSIQISQNFPTLTTWLEAIAPLPKNRQGADAFEHSAFISCGNKDEQWEEFETILDAWLEMMADRPLSNPYKWSPTDELETIPPSSFFDITAIPPKTIPYAQKIIVPADSVLYMRGDLHGDIHSLAAQLERMFHEQIIDDNFKIIQPNTWIIFLGDYVDRGQYGCEVIYTMMRLALANPKRVIAVRGNHEEININLRDGFAQEVFEKFDDTLSFEKLNLISRMNDFLPAVLFIGCTQDNGITNFLQCCHGGIEIGYNPRSFLDQKETSYQQIINVPEEIDQSIIELVNHVSRKRPVINYIQELNNLNIPAIKDLLENHPIYLGLLWNDFDPENKTQIKANTSRGVGIMYGQLSTEDILNIQSSSTSILRGILRAHQHSGDPHNPIMQGLIQSNGVYKLWSPYETEQKRYLHDGLVWTFNVGADSVYGESCGFNFDTYAKITTAKNYNEWTMELFNQQILMPTITPTFLAAPSVPTLFTQAAQSAPSIVPASATPSTILPEDLESTNPLIEDQSMLTPNEDLEEFEQ